jgi:esterase/lipase superfamily enzyme
MPTRVYFGTNREPIRNAAGEIVGFGPDPAHGFSGDLRFGQAMVENGKVVQIQVLPDTPGDGSASLFRELQNKMRDQGRDTMIIIHGYATSWEQAIVGAAHTKETFKEANLNVFSFSWPSDGKNVPPQAYANDRHDAEQAGEAFKRGFLKACEFLSDGEQCGQRIHLGLHSMGNYVGRWTLLALCNWFKGAALPQIFENIFSWAADEDADALEPDQPERDGPKWTRMPELTKHLHIYFNNHDHALNFSDATKNNPARLGSDGPAKPGSIHSKVTLVDVTRCENWVKAISTLGHGYYDEHPKVIADILQVLKGVPPDKVEGREYIPAKNRYVIV